VWTKKKSGLIISLSLSLSLSLSPYLSLPLPLFQKLLPESSVQHAFVNVLHQVAWKESIRTVTVLAQREGDVSWIALENVSISITDIHNRKDEREPGEERERGTEGTQRTKKREERREKMSQHTLSLL
jgi:hypothetical protein